MNQVFEYKVGLPVDAFVLISSVQLLRYGCN